MHNNWAVNTGVCGRHFKKYLDNHTWKEYETTFADANRENNWNAFFNAISLFGKLGRIIGNELGYEYPDQIEKEMMEYYQLIYKKRNEARSLPGKE